MLCSWCSTELPSDARFCDQCGFEQLAKHDQVSLQATRQLVEARDWLIALHSIVDSPLKGDDEPEDDMELAVLYQGYAEEYVSHAKYPSGMHGPQAPSIAQEAEQLVAAVYRQQAKTCGAFALLHKLRADRDAGRIDFDRCDELSESLYSVIEADDESEVVHKQRNLALSQLAEKLARLGHGVNDSQCRSRS